MDRFSWSDGALSPGETFVTQVKGVDVYDGEDKKSGAYNQGSLILTTHRLLWRDQRDQKCIFALPLSLVVFSEESAAGFNKSAKVQLHLNPSPPGKAPGPISHSANTFITMAFKEGGGKEYYRCLSEELAHKRWQHQVAPQDGTKSKTRQVRAGIVGIERHIEKKNAETGQNISVSFEDLSKLMAKAKEMVTLSQKITQQIKDKQGDISEDETIKFKSYLLSLGIADPVTRETHGTGNKYYTELAKQLSAVLTEPVKECGGMMTLTDVYCRVNRARGMELLSPEDLVNACRLLEFLKQPIRLRVFDSGVMVLQSQNQDEAQIIKITSQTVKEKESMTAEELSQHVGISVILAKERLLSCEKVGGLCRDESVEGLRFYLNRFLTEPAA